MVSSPRRSLALAVGLAALAAGCELLVELDRSAADGGGDAACPICSDAFEDVSADAGLSDASPPDASAPPADAHADGSIADSGHEGGG
jgi:hypothetical protein